MTPNDRMNDALAQPVHPEGQGEDPLIKQIITQGDTLKDSEASKLLYQIQTMLTGFNEENEKRFNYIEARFDERSRADSAFKADQKLFLENLSERANNLRITDPDDKARFEATQSNIQQQAITKATVRHRDAKKRLAEEPQEAVYWPGDWMTTREGESSKHVHVPVTINIENIIYRYKPGEVVQVPQSVAARLRERARDMEKNEQTKSAYSPSKNGLFKEAEQINQELAEIDAGAEMLPVG